MEEKKQRNKFYSAWAKGIVIALFLTAVAIITTERIIWRPRIVDNGWLHR